VVWLGGVRTRLGCLRCTCPPGRQCAAKPVGFAAHDDKVGRFDDLGRGGADDEVGLVVGSRSAFGGRRAL
jgi:hypothetical protein